MTGKKLDPPNDPPRVYPSRIDLGYSIVDEYSGEYWYDPGEITPKVYPSYTLALLALTHIKRMIMADRTQGHKPQPIIVPWLEDRELAQEPIKPLLREYHDRRKILSENQRASGARVIA